MSRPAPSDSRSGYTVERYFGLVATGVLRPDERVELLDGVIVSMSPQSPRHAAVVTRAANALRAAVAGRATVREEKPLVVGPFGVPEPDIAVVPGEPDGYEGAHPSAALLVVEVADTSLAQDRLTKVSIYARAGIPEYWIIDLRDDRLEILRAPNAGAGTYGQRRVVEPEEVVELVALPGVVLAAAAVLPRRRPPDATA